MTDFASFVDALEQLLTGAGYSVVTAPEEVTIGSALVLPGWRNRNARQPAGRVHPRL